MKYLIFIILVGCLSEAKVFSAPDLTITTELGEKVSTFTFDKKNKNYVLSFKTNDGFKATTTVSKSGYLEIIKDIKLAGQSRLPAGQCYRKKVVAVSKDIKETTLFGCLEDKSPSTVKWIQIVNTLALML